MKTDLWGFGPFFVCPRNQRPFIYRIFGRCLLLPSIHTVVL
jgi:hypothetical protein